MAKLNELFEDMINKAIQCSNETTDVKIKADIYTNIALAIATTGLVTSKQEKNERKVKGSEELINDELAVEPTKEKRNHKEELKRKPEKIDPPKVEVEDKTEPETEDNEPEESKDEVKIDTVPQFTTEWTEEAQEYYSEDIAFYQNFAEQNGEDLLNQVLIDFSDGCIKNSDEVNPLNIRAIVEYIKQLLADEEISA